MSSKVKLVKKTKSDQLTQVITKNEVKSDQERNREIVGVIKSWIDDFKLHTAAKTEAALILLTK